jgi:hypothetical protein
MGCKKKRLDAKAIIFKRLFGVKPEPTVYTLKYLREYRTTECIRADYGISKSRVCEMIRWVEDTLIKDKTFKLPARKFSRKF